MDTYYLNIAKKYYQEYYNSDVALNGHNGPYFQEETHVRNTAHWIISFSTLYALTNDVKYKSIIARFSHALLHEVDKSANGSIKCINKENDQTNGLIGLAWAIEGLVEAYIVLKDATFLDAAEKIYFSQKYDNNLHTWRIIDPNSSDNGFDVAFNHSLWFCMSAAKLVHQRRNSEIEQNVSDYLNNVECQFIIYNSGLISHFMINSDNILWNFKMRFRKSICSITGKGLPWKNWNTIEYERAYHLFSLYAFAWLYYFYPNASFFGSKKFKLLKEYGLNKQNFISFPEMNSFAYGYNSPAYELPFIHYVFSTGKDDECAKNTLMLHKKYNLASDGVSYSNNVSDPLTLDARIYEMMQYYKLKELHHE